MDLWTGNDSLSVCGRRRKEAAVLTVCDGHTQSFAGKRWSGPRGTQPTTPPLSQNCPQNIDGWTVTNCALMAQNCPLSRIKISAKESCPRRYLLPFILQSFTWKKSVSCFNPGWYFASPPPCQLGSLYGMEFRIAFDLKHNLPCGDERISALSFDCEGESLISHKIAIKLSLVFHQISNWWNN